MLRKKLTKLFCILLLPSLLLGDGQSQYEKFKEKIKSQITKDNFFTLGFLFLVYVLFSSHVETEVKEQGKWWEDFAKDKKDQDEKEAKQRKEAAEKLKKEIANILVKNIVSADFDDAVYNSLFTDGRYIKITNNIGATKNNCKLLDFFGLNTGGAFKLNKRELMLIFHADKKAFGENEKINQAVSQLLSDCCSQYSKIMGI